MMRSAAADDFVGWRLQLLCRRQFLKRRLGMLRSPALMFEQRCPELADERLCDVHASVDEQCSNQGFDDVSDDIIAPVGAILTGLFAKPDERWKSNVAP